MRRLNSREYAISGHTWLSVPQAWGQACATSRQIQRCLLQRSYHAAKKKKRVRVIHKDVILRTTEIIWVSHGTAFLVLKRKYRLLASNIRAKMQKQAKHLTSPLTSRKADGMFTQAAAGERAGAKICPSKKRLEKSTCGHTPHMQQ